MGQRFTKQVATFFDATSDAILFLDRNYCFTFVNRRAYELLAGCGDLIGTNLFDTFPETLNPPYRENYHRSMELREATEFDAFYPEPLDLWLHIEIYPNDDGVMVFFRDITKERFDREELQHKREEAERQHAELETVYRTAPIGLALFDTKDFRYLRLNDRQAAFFGLKPEQILGRTLTEMAPIEGLRELFEQVLAGEPVINFPLEGTLVTDPNDYRYWTVSYFPVFGPDGNIQAITAASLEITQQKKAEMALLQSEKLAVVGRLASSIAHEINNPLEAVTNLIYLARHSDNLDSVRTHLDMAESELRRMAAITNQTLRFHKQASSPMAITPENLLESVLAIYQGRIGNSHVTVRERRRALKPVHCFEGEIRQVLSNLVSNALDAMNSHPGTLYLRTRLATHWRSGESGITITVADTGSGMDARTRTKLFDAFFTTKGVIGTGLGLWVSKEIIDRHRGSIQVRSSQSSVHHGTVFVLFLPFDAVVR
jgi:PAS domain S-box-containing protein